MFLNNSWGTNSFNWNNKCSEYKMKSNRHKLYKDLSHLMNKHLVYSIVKIMPQMVICKRILN